MTGLAANRLLEQNRRAFGAQHAVADFGHFELRIDLNAHPLQLAGFFQLRHEIAQVVIFHRINLFTAAWQALINASRRQFSDKQKRPAPESCFAPD